MWSRWRSWWRPTWGPEHWLWGDYHPRLAVVAAALLLVVAAAVAEAPGAALVALGQTDGRPLGIAIAFLVSPFVWLLPVFLVMAILSGPVGLLVIGAAHIPGLWRDLRRWPGRRRAVRLAAERRRLDPEYRDELEHDGAAADPPWRLPLGR